MLTLLNSHKHCLSPVKFQELCVLQLYSELSKPGLESSLVLRLIQGVGTETLPVSSGEMCRQTNQRQRCGRLQGCRSITVHGNAALVPSSGTTEIPNPDPGSGFQKGSIPPLSRNELNGDRVGRERQPLPRLSSDNRRIPTRNARLLFLYDRTQP
jgi:hypothetical protein